TMTTRAATFSAKIRTLSEFHTRIASNQQPPSTAEILTTLRYFQQTLIGFLKELPAVPESAFERYSPDLQRSSLYPNLNYSALFYGIVNLLDVFPQIGAAQAAIGDAILDTIKALYFFLQRDALEQLPYLVACQLGVFPSELDKKVVRLLSECLIPFTLSSQEWLSVPAVLMLVLQHSSDPSLHTLLIESLMARKEGVYKDVILVLSKGTSESRIAAANLLFHYWPLLNPHILHRKPIQYRVQAWSCSPCQNVNCLDKDTSSRLCYDPGVCTQYGDTAPPIALCKTCAEMVEREKKVATRAICNPMATTDNVVCQNRACESTNRLAVGTCFSEDCIRSHHFVPLRLCQECFTALHAETATPHIRHSGMTCAWGSPLERDIVEAVVKLLKETSCNLEGTESEGKRPKWLRQLEGGHSLGREIDRMADERRMLSRFGVWLLAALCPPVPEARPQAIGYMMSMLFQWFATTALLPNDSMGATLEQLKTDFVSDWINLAISNHYDVFIETLMPNPPEYAQVGGVWDKFSTKKEQMREGLTKLLAIMPYDIITLGTWNRIIPHWLQTICEQIADEHLPELKILLCKIFEPDLCPLPFEAHQIYEFIIDRLTKGDELEISNALDWIHVLSRMEICIPLTLLLDAFSRCVVRLSQIETSPSSENDLEEGRIAAQVAMVDIIAQQLKMTEMSVHEISALTEHIFSTCADLLQNRFARGEHSCDNPEMDGFLDCSACQQSAFVYQTVAQLIEQLCPKQQMRIAVQVDEPAKWESEVTNESEAPSNLTSIVTPKVKETSDMPSTATHAVVDTSENPLLRFQTANVLEEEQSCEFVGVLPTEEVETAMAQATTLTETDVGHETCQVVTATLVDNVKGATPLQSHTPKPTSEFWDTSVGRFRFSIANLPPQLRLINALLTNLDSEPDSDVQFFMLSTLKLLCLHCESLLNARREHRGFLIWAQENLLIPKLWSLLRSDHSQLGELAVPLIMHCITLPCGEDMFWKTVNTQFTDARWQERFKAVERMCVLCGLANAAPVKANKVIQTSLSCGVAHLIASVHDPNAAIAQRAILAIRAMPSSSLKLMCFCLESQFDTSMVDRALIISRIHLLTAILPDEEILTWDFFIQRFESLALESQLQSQNSESSFVHDLMHSDPMSDLYQRKVMRARQAIESSATARSIVRSLKGNSLRHQLSNNSANAPSDEQKEADLRSPTYTSSGNFGRLREFADEESNMCLLLNRVVDMENPERHIVYLTVSLFVTFLCNKKTAGDEKATAKKQSVLVRHFNTLIGYSNSEKCFTIPPRRLRRSAVCNAFLCGLPEILDSKLVIANQIVMLGVQLLLHLPSPQRLASDQPTSEYSLAALDINQRHLWLNTTILILYKYRYETPPFSDLVCKLISIVICTLECQVHVCDLKSAPAKVEFAPWSEGSSADEEEDSDVKDERPLRRPETLSVAAPQTFTIITEKGVHLTETTRIVTPTIVASREELGEAKLESISEEGSEETSKISKRKSRWKRRITKGGENISERSCLRCGYCNEQLQSFDEETLSLCLIAIETFVHREPTMAAPMLFRIINTVTRVVERALYPWHDSPMFVAGNSRSVAKQLLRVVLHQMSSSGICLQLFDMNIERASSFWSTISFSLADFTELSPVAIIQILLEDILNEWPSRLSRILFNLAAYLPYVPPDAYFSHWSAVISSLDSFFRRLLSQMQSEANRSAVRTELKSCFEIMSVVLRVQNFSTFKSSVSLVDSFAKWLTEAMHECKADLLDMLTVCTACNRALVRERDKQCLTKAIVSELIQAIKFKCEMHEHNYMAIVELVLQDAGESVSEEINDDQFNTAACEAIRPYLFDVIEFISDLHVLAKLKKLTSSDSVGGDMKASLAQVVALEMSRSSVRDSRTVLRYIPWLMSPPSVTQAAPGAFAESVTNVRILSWLLLGALHATQPCLPVPIECSQHIADYIHFVLAGFADQSKQSVVHMSALFHAFHLCQLWTVYCEQAAVSTDDLAQKAFANVLDFWARVTPAILQLLSHSKVLADMVNLHFLNTMQALQQCNSAVLCELSAMWQPILTAYHAQIPSQLRIKLDSCENQPSLQSEPLAQWLKRVRYKISQIELQTSAASPFYNV
uniref:Uncoordinated protein 79 n=1 Tax=Parascaris univalens TaxID=6257 RepID=A0A915CI63_PARUN